MSVLCVGVCAYVLLCVACVGGSTHPSCHKSADVCHVCHEDCTHTFTDLHGGVCVCGRG